MFGAYASSFMEASEEPTITDPVTEIPWKSVFWASSISSRPAEGAAAPSSITNLGTDGGDWVKNNAVVWTRAFGGSIRDAAVFGSGNFYSLTSPSYGERTVVVIGQVGDTDNVDMFDTAPTRTVVDASGGNFRLFAGDVTEAGPADTDPHLFVVHVVSGGSTSFEIDGDLKATGTASQAGGTALSLGDSGLGSGNAPGSKVAFAGYIDRALTTNEKAALLTWYRSFYAPVFFGLDAGTPPNTGTFGDGGDRIRLGTWFNSVGGLNTGWKCSGGRVYIAPDWPGLIGSSVRITAFLQTLPATGSAGRGGPYTGWSVTATVDVVCKGTGWIEGSWTPFDFTDGQAVFIMYEWLAPFAGTYSFQAGTERSQSHIESPNLPGLYLVEGEFNRCYFTQDLGDPVFLSSSFGGAWYGCDIIVEAP